MRIYTLIFFLLILSICVNGVYVDDKVNDLLNNNTNVNVIIKFTDKGEFLKRDFNANSIVSNLNDDEFKGKILSLPTSQPEGKWGVSSPFSHRETGFRDEDCNSLLFLVNQQE